MFPEQFAREHIAAWTRPGDLVIDPFCGRGTTVIEALLLGRMAAGVDINPVAACISTAKVTAPFEDQVRDRLNKLRKQYKRPKVVVERKDPFFRACFSTKTLNQLAFLRRRLKWRERSDDCFLAALILGVLHGESHRSERYLSNRMSRTIAMKPRYSVNWWKARGLVPPVRDVFDILDREISFRYRSPIPRGQAKVVQADARRASKVLKTMKGKAKLLLTSPPYLDTTHFEEDQWLRLWFLGGPRMPKRSRGDHRHSSADNYWRFLSEAFAGSAALLAEDATIVVRIGGKRLSFEEAQTGLRHALSQALGRKLRLVRKVQSPVSGSQRRVFLPANQRESAEYDFVYRVGSKVTALSHGR
jgi:hypothetical protein